MYFWKAFHLEISHGVDMQTLKNANAEIERLREEMHNFHQPSSRLYQSVKNAVERKAKGLREFRLRASLPCPDALWTSSPCVTGNPRNHDP